MDGDAVTCADGVGAGGGVDGCGVEVPFGVGL